MVNQSKREYLARIKDRYRHAGRAGKKIILDEFCRVCEYHRKHAIRLLNADGRRRKKKPGRPSRYGAAELQVLESIWLCADRPCSARLVSMIALWLPHYEKHHGDLDEAVRGKLLGISERTLDRALAKLRRKHGSRGLSGTRKGDALPGRIPIKISHREVQEPGFIQADTVAHCDGSMQGSFVWSLTFTDVFTGWTENGAVWNKGQHEVHQLLRSIEEGLPFCLRGFHTDNGSEFLNHHLHSYFRNRKTPVDMTRGRPGKKNDNPHAEQKNWTHVRLLLGYQRIEDPALIADINLLYQAANLLNNFFGATRRLTHKERRGSRYYKRFDQATTPCDRLLACGKLSPLQVARLTLKKESLDPYKLRTLIDAQRKKILSKLR